MNLGIHHLRVLFAKAHPAEIQEGRAAYWRYHRLCSQVAERNGFSSIVGAAVFSALSPNNDYLGNLRDMRRLLEARSQGMDTGDFRVSTYGQNKLKAWRIACGAAPLRQLTALKTRNFFLNVCQPDNPEPVTVDGHMYWCWHGRRGRVTGHKPKGSTVPTNRDGAAKMSPRLYREIAQGIRTLAEEVGLLPNQAQAVLWLTYRRVHNIQGTRQLELLPKDCDVAGVEAF